MDIKDIDKKLASDLDRLTFSPPVTHVYNPLLYAWDLHAAFLDTYGTSTPREVVLLGMNPGPWGMGQTGVPFGDPTWVKDWMGLQASVNKPVTEHPKRKILGLDSPRSEVSGSRLYGWANSRFGTAERFFDRFFLLNYCPLAFLESTGRNRTPDKLPAAEKAPLFAACDAALRAKIDILAPTYLIGVGAFAEACIRRVFGKQPEGMTIGRVLHPSPASPKANRGWVPAAEADLAKLGIALPE